MKTNKMRYKAKIYKGKCDSYTNMLPGDRNGSPDEFFILYFGGLNG